MNVFQRSPIFKNNSTIQTKQNTWLISHCFATRQSYKTRQGGSKYRGLRSCHQLYDNKGESCQLICQHRSPIQNQSHCLRIT